MRRPLDPTHGPTVQEAVRVGHDSAGRLPFLVHLSLWWTLTIQSRPSSSPASRARSLASSAGCGGSGKEGGRQVILAAAAKHKAGIQGRIVEARRIQGKVAEALLSTARIMAYN